MIRTGTLWRRVQAPLAGAAALLFAVAAAAAPTYTVTVSPNVDLGSVTSGTTGDTVFRVDPATGSVTTLSGTGIRSSSGTTRATVTISCAATQVGDCTKVVNVKLGAVGSPTGRARTLTHILFTMGTAVLAGTPGNPNSPTFPIAAIGPNSSKTFFVGADFGVAGDDSGLPTGNAESDFFAWAAESPAAPTTGDIGRFQAKIIRGITIAKTSDLAFGSVAKPTSGLGSVTIDATTGVRTTTGGAVGMASPTPTRAAFNVTGEGGQAFSITIPATFQMTGPQAMTVTTSNSASGSPFLSGSLGSQGVFAFGVGGTAPINASTLSGDYTGNFTVTVAYN